MTADWDALGRYHTAVAQARQADVQRALAAMSERERALFREAAVMGYVQGCRQGSPLAQIAVPPDSEVVGAVVDACLAMPDLYPVVDRLREGS